MSRFYNLYSGKFKFSDCTSRTCPPFLVKSIRDWPLFEILSIQNEIPNFKKSSQTIIKVLEVVKRDTDVKLFFFRQTILHVVAFSCCKILHSFFFTKSTTGILYSTFFLCCVLICLCAKMGIFFSNDSFCG